MRAKIRISERNAKENCFSFVFRLLIRNFAELIIKQGNEKD